MVTFKSKSEIAKMRAAGEVIVRIFELCERIVKPGVSTGEVDAQVDTLIRDSGNRASFKGYMGYPASICASVNEEVVHGIPSERVLRDGDLLTVDVGVIHQGWHADAARSYAVGAINAERTELAQATADGLDAGIKACQVGHRLSHIARAVEAEGRRHQFGVVEQYVGHGIGTALHEEPQVPNLVTPSLLRNDMVLRPGLVIAIEPMFNLGTAETRTKSDGWTVVTKDGRCSAHFEDTVAITDDGPEVLTRRSAKDRIWNVTPRSTS